jgi:hypothetical protein
MRIKFDYAWYGEGRRVIRYSARDGWTWKDFHAVTHVSQHAATAATEPVHVIIDFSTGVVERFPGGAAAHARTFGKRHNDAFSGKAIVIGLPDAVLTKLGVHMGGVLPTSDGEAHFVADEAAARALLEAWEAI